MLLITHRNRPVRQTPSRALHPLVIMLPSEHRDEFFRSLFSLPSQALQMIEARG